MMLPTILLPLFVQVALTFALLFWMGFARVGSIKRKKTRIADVALGQPKWPTEIQQISNCFANQFQLPILFYVLVALAILTKTTDLLFLVMSWVFVLSRLVHAYIHTTSNHVPRRFNAYLVGAVILLAMWIVFAARILLGLP